MKKRIEKHYFLDELEGDQDRFLELVRRKGFGEVVAQYPHPQREGVSIVELEVEVNEEQERNIKEMEENVESSTGGSPFPFAENNQEESGD